MFHVITGGSGSGKSAYAEQCILEFAEENRIYIATMYPFDEESYARIRRHREMRKEKKFHTIECYTGLKNMEVPEHAQVLLECMSNLTANEMYQEQGAGIHTVEEILEGVRRLKSQAENLIVVTNEVFSDGIIYDSDTQRYLSYLGKINQEMTKMADKVTEVVYGIPLCILDTGKEKEKENEKILS